MNTQNKNGTVMYKTFVYWPDGGWRESPDDGFVYNQNNQVYVWDDFLESWVTGYNGDIVDFTPQGMPSKVASVEKGDSNKNANSVPCECGALKTSNPNAHSHWCPRASS
jgi:hypothetical protein